MKNNTKPILDDLLARYLAEEASPDERRQVDEWVAASPENEQALAAYRLIWEQTQTLPTPAVVDTDKAWEKVKRRMNRPETVIRPLHTPVKSSRWVLRIAASLLLIAGVSWVAYQFVNSNEPTTKVLATQQFHLEQQLPDGTLVYLNANSTLSYPSDFEGNLRSVRLKGEAFFHVKPDASKPFVIEANGTTIRVLGTSFNVRAYDQNVKVNVETGKVSFGTPKHQIKLTKGEAAEFEAKSDTVIKLNSPSKNVLSYKTKLFLFEETPLSEVVQLLNDAYQSKIVLRNKKLAQCKLTSNFNNEDVETIVAVIAETFDLHVERSEGKIWLDGKGCSQ
ncbi:MAG: FecR domain-containing protein [Spirosomataceae bacterium]